MRPANALLGLVLCLPAVAWAEWTNDAELCATIVEDHELALAHCTIAIKSGLLDADELSRTFSNRAYELNQLDRPAEAVQDATRAIELNPENPYAWNNRGTYLRALGRVDEALSDFNEALRVADAYATNTTVGVDPGFGASVNAAEIYRERGDLSGGQSYVRRAFAFSPDHPDYQELFRWYGLR